MKKLYKWLVEKFGEQVQYDAKLLNIWYDNKETGESIYIGKYTSPYVGYIGHIIFNGNYKHFELYKQEDIKDLIVEYMNNEVKE